MSSAAPRTAVILTTYNRPRLVHDAIESVLNQHDKSVRLIIMDDGSSAEHRSQIEKALGNPGWQSVCQTAGGIAATTESTPFPVTWWKGPDRDMAARKASIPYSLTINVALNSLLRGERYVAYLCDDDAFYPESVGDRANFLDEHSEVHVAYGRLRAVQYASDGYNKWDSAAPPIPGVIFARPTGLRVQETEGGKRCYFQAGETDPQTGLPYCEEGYWEPGDLIYGTRGSTDHNQVMHRVQCLHSCRAWPRKLDGTFEFWGEDIRHGVGDAAFFLLLGKCHPFRGINVWTVTKKYHALSDGASNAELRD